MKRIQRKRTKGWKMPPNTVYVGRPSKWGNPFTVGVTYKNGAGYIALYDCTDVEKLREVSERGIYITLDKSLEMYRRYIALRNSSDSEQKLPLEDLRDKNLCCWCSLDRPCHADILLELANT